MHESTRRELQDELIRYAKTVNRLRYDNAKLLGSLRYIRDNTDCSVARQWVIKTLKEYGVK